MNGPEEEDDEETCEVCGWNHPTDTACDTDDDDSERGGQL